MSAGHTPRPRNGVLLDNPLVGDVVTISGFDSAGDPIFTTAPPVAASPSYVTSLPTSPADGQEVYFAADQTAGIVWHLRYRAASASAYKWEYVGGPPIYNAVGSALADDTTTSTSYADLSVVGPSLAVPLAGDYEVTLSMEGAQNDSAGNAALIALAKGASAPDEADRMTVGSVMAPMTLVLRASALAASALLKAKYKTSGTGTARVRGVRRMYVRPVRVG